MVYADEELKKYYEAAEYNFCIEKLSKALKPLKFDIIKDKGQPISEEIYLEVWIDDDGKIENWTD